MSISPTRTPLPWKQLLTLMLVRIAEPSECASQANPVDSSIGLDRLSISWYSVVTFCVIFPFINEQILWTGITNDPEKVGYYSGGVESLFALSQFFFSVPWANLADRWGRRPVILTGLTGITILGILYGFATSFWMLLLIRASLGIVNGIIAPLRSSLYAITDSTNQSEAFLIYGLTWNIGTIVANSIGGSFPGPGRWVGWGGEIERWTKRWPYAGPCVMAGILSMTGLICAGVLYKETNEAVIARNRTRARNKYVEDSTGEESLQLVPTSKGSLEGPMDDKIDDPVKIGLLPSARSASQITLVAADRDDDSLTPTQTKAPWTARRLLKLPAMRLLMAVVFIQQMQVNGYMVLMLLFLYTPMEDGGCGLSVAALGWVLTIQGIIIVPGQLLLMPVLKRRLGIYRAFKYSNAWLIPTALVMPLLRLIVIRTQHGQTGDSLNWLTLITIIGYLLFALPIHPCNVFSMVIINEMAPDKTALDSLSGLSVAAACLAKAAGPPFTSALFAVSISRNLIGGQFWWIAFATFCVMASLLAAMLPDESPASRDQDLDEGLLLKKRMSRRAAGDGDGDVSRSESLKRL